MSHANKNVSVGKAPRGKSVRGESSWQLWHLLAKAVLLLLVPSTVVSRLPASTLVLDLEIATRIHHTSNFAWRASRCRHP